MADHPIHQSIQLLDQLGMEAIAFESPTGHASTAHKDFTTYLRTTRNSICGRHPIGVLLAAIAVLETQEQWKGAHLQWLKYAQSGQCSKLSDSSVSYASGFVAL